MVKVLRKIVGTVFDYIWTLFLSGLITILPITLTAMLFNASLRLLKSWLEPVHSLLPLPLQAIPYSEIILVLIGIFLIGTILNLFIIRSLIHSFESILFRLPLVRPVYSGIKQLVHAFSFQDRFGFKQAIVIEFPRKGVYSIGFLTSEVPQELNIGKEKLFNVFVPTTPNPTSGFFIMAPESDIVNVNLTRQEAMALVISGGIIQPERFTPRQTHPQ